KAFVDSLFQVVSFATSTGFTLTHYTTWPNFILVFLLLGAFIGGCARSTAGGMKVARFILLFKQGVREINRLIHPSAEIPIKMGGKTVPDRVVQAVWGFFSAYVTVFAIAFLGMLATGMDTLSAFTA